MHYDRPTRPEDEIDSPEDTLCDKVTLEQLLQTLPEQDRALMLMVAKIDAPADYTGPWPASHEDIGTYIGTKYGGRPIAPGTVRYHRARILSALQRMAGCEPDAGDE